MQAITFASCYVYSPTGVGAVSERSRLLRALLKSADAEFIRRYALRVRQQATDSPPLAGFFASTDVLIPVPGSAPHAVGTIWVAEHLAGALVKEGLGGLAWSGLQRVRAVRKSATAAPGERPSVNLHYESFIFDRPTMPIERFILIDDVVTRGRTLLAAATRVHEAFPGPKIQAFALVRTMGLISEVQQLLAPCKGEIRWRAGDAHRSP